MNGSAKAPGVTKRSGRVMVALVLGTALSALGPAASAASEKTLLDLNRYCTACWRNARLPVDCWGDCTQDVFIRLLERVPATRWEQSLRGEGDERRELHRAIDAVKKRVQRSRTWLPYPEQVAERDAEGRRELTDRREQLRDAVQQLSERQRLIVQRTIEGYDVTDIAQELGMSPARVSDEKYKAVRKLRSFFNSDAVAV